MKSPMTTGKILRRLLVFAKSSLPYLILALVSAAVSVGMSLWAPVLIGNSIDFIVERGRVDFNAVAKIMLILAVSIAVGALFQWILAYATNKAAYKTVNDMRTAVFQRLLKTPLSYIDSHPHGDFISRVTMDIDQISVGLLQGFTQLFTGVITIIGTLLFMLSVNAVITVVVVLVTPLSLFVAAFIARLSSGMFRKQSAERGEMSTLVEEMVGNQKVVTAFSYEKRAQEKFEEINSRLYQSGVKSQFYSSLTNPSTRFVNGLVYALVGITGAVSAVSGRLSVGQLSCFLTYANQYTKPFNEITGVLTELQSALASAARVFEVMDAPTEESDQGKPELTDGGAVKISNVDFSYSPDKPLIEDFNMEVKPGQRIAIVGPTGCGKTTLINLLMRFYDVNDGSICVNGHDIRSVTRKSLRSQYGMVLQDTWLFSGTVRENIAYGCSNASEEEIIKAAKAAHTHSFIKRLPHGYDTVLSEDGGNISQGQKQLLCIARVLLTKPDMLILDEATSSIDTLTELRIQQTFQQMMQGRTSFIVAHRLSTIREADTILVMNQGHIIEQGTHSKLLEKGGFYAELYNSQFAGNVK